MDTTSMDHTNNLASMQSQAITNRIVRVCACETRSFPRKRRDSRHNFGELRSDVFDIPMGSQGFPRGPLGRMFPAEFGFDHEEVWKFGPEHEKVWKC